MKILTISPYTLTLSRKTGEGTIETGSPIQGRNPEVRAGQREYDTNRVPPFPATNVCRGGGMWPPAGVRGVEPHATPVIPSPPYCHPERPHCHTLSAPNMSS